MNLNNIWCNNIPCVKDDFLFEPGYYNNNLKSPIIEVMFESGKGKITVGNKSYPGNFNRAIVKSLNFGFSDGLAAELEIFDEDGGDISAFLNLVAKDPKEASMKYEVQIKFGWLLKDCYGEHTYQDVCTPKTFFITGLEMSYDTKGISFKLSLRDLMNATFSKRIRDCYEGTVEQAIKQMFKDVFNDNKGIDVYFKRIKKDKSITLNAIRNISPNDLDDVEWSTKLVVDKWKTNNLAPLDAARDWVSKLRTKNDKGFLEFFHNMNKYRSLLFLEDPTPICVGEKNNTSPCLMNIGTYIVNGGKYSPVISFNPTVKFFYDQLGRSGAGFSNGTAQSSKTPGQPCPGDDKSKDGQGSETRVQPTSQSTKQYGPKNDIKETEKSIIANERANALYFPYEVDMKIVGEPRFETPLMMKICTCTVIVINPFHLKLKNNYDMKECPTWALASPPCNEAFSSRNYQIRGVNHEINREGFNTTLKLYLLPDK